MNAEDLAERLMQIDALLDDAVHSANLTVDGQDVDRDAERANAAMLAAVAQALCARIAIEPPEQVGGDFVVPGEDDEPDPEPARGPGRPFFMGG